MKLVIHLSTNLCIVSNKWSSASIEYFKLDQSIEKRMYQLTSIWDRHEKHSIFRKMMDSWPGATSFITSKNPKHETPPHPHFETDNFKSHCASILGILSCLIFNFLSSIHLFSTTRSLLINCYRK